LTILLLPVFLCLVEGKAKAQVAVALYPSAKQVFFCNETLGFIPCAGGTVTLYNAGTTTAAPVYTDSTGTILLANPVTLDSNGSATIWLANQSYDVVLKDSGGVQQWKVLNVSAWAILNAQTLFLTSVTSDPAGGVAGEMVYRSDIPCFRVFTTLWDCVAQVNATQTLINKTFNLGNNSLTATGASTGNVPRYSSISGNYQNAQLALQDVNITNSNVNPFLINGTNVAGNGIGVLANYGWSKSTGLTANLGTAVIFTNPAIGVLNSNSTYLFSCYVSVSSPATTSSTLPSCVVTWNDFVSGVAMTATVTPTNAGNTTATYQSGTVVISAGPGSNIQFSTTGYASSGASALIYAVQARLNSL
jgi:hypothetical protein